MSEELTFTGERYVPGVAGEIAHEHWHRYAFARRYVGGLRILDAACGEGYGSALLSETAATVFGVDIDAATLAHAQRTYRERTNLSFVVGSVTALPLPDATVDIVTSFETIEHIDAADQSRMLSEFARVLAPGGLLVLSSPNRPQYSEARNYVNPFHRRELDRDELMALLAPHFPAVRWHRQRRYLGSALWCEQGTDRHEALSGSAAGVIEARTPEAMYFVVVAAREAASLPADFPALSLFTDAAETELARIDAEARKVLELDTGLLACMRELDGERARTKELEARAAGALEASEAAAASASTLCAQCEAQLAAQERIIGERETLRWWLALPRLRLRRALARFRL